MLARFTRLWPPSRHWAAVGEYFGDTMLVNGKVWPFLGVEQRIYRPRFLNGCNARILSLDNGGVRFWKIGAEGDRGWRLSSRNDLCRSRVVQ
jgi:FtsP/CotA-like multicopper oxidase with cupredoxin domain